MDPPNHPSFDRTNSFCRYPKNKTDRIIILGAGPAGIHIARELKRLGYSNVKILEQNNRVGGKSKSVVVDNVPYEMGTCFLSTSYTEVHRKCCSITNFSKGTQAN